MPESLRLYLDQMFQVELAQVLRAQGYDVLRASETGQARADDRQILDKAISEGRILITLDEHFGDWVILPLSRHFGVIRLKVHPTTPENILKVLVPFLSLYSQEQFSDYLVILSEKRAKWIRTTG
jgi:predicted nuclease of predicted toxin-antitoxin system